MTKRHLGMAALAWLLVPVQDSRATVAVRDAAVKAGYAAQDCGYCHSFESNHMREQARAMGVSSLNCLVCHGNKLPKSGAALFNARGRFLLSEKARLKAEHVDVSWLENYRPPSPQP